MPTVLAIIESGSAMRVGARMKVCTHSCITNRVGVLYKLLIRPRMIGCPCRARFWTEYKYPGAPQCPRLPVSSVHTLCSCMHNAVECDGLLMRGFRLPSMDTTVTWVKPMPYLYPQTPQRGVLTNRTAWIRDSVEQNLLDLRV
jgi:hypothetical protein